MHRDVEELIRYLAERGSLPHEWGSDANDCISFLAAAIEAQTGRAQLGRLKWKNERQALTLLKKLGGIEAALDARFERIAPAHAHRGDIGGIPDDRLGVHPMLVEGRTLCSPGQRQLKRCPRAAMTVAWDVMQPKKARA